MKIANIFFAASGITMVISLVCFVLLIKALIQSRKYRKIISKEKYNFDIGTMQLANKADNSNHEDF